MSRITLNQGIQHQYTPSGTDIQGQVHLDKLSDVTVTNVQNNQVLKYNSSLSQWVNVTTGSITNLDDLADVVITSVQNDQSLQYNSTTGKWENADIVASSIDGGTY